MYIVTDNTPLSKFLNPCRWLVGVSIHTQYLHTTWKIMDILNFVKSITLVLAVTQFAACSSGPPPKRELSLTHASIRSAESAGASSLAPKALRTAQQKVQKAEVLIGKKDHEKAKRLLIEAMADAELAEAQSETEKSKIAYAELQQGIDLIKQEIARAKE